MNAKILQFPDRPSPESLHRKVRELAQDSGNIVWITPDYAKYAKKDGLNTRIILDTLRNGELNGSPRKDKKGNWRVNITNFISGRVVTVNVSLMNNYIIVHRAT